jgi:3-hydroxyisobutyrate dehydrogenase-like beta-hydroxyacid dehydrogenase
VAASPAQAARGAAIVITMLADGPATEQAATEPDGFAAVYLTACAVTAVAASQVAELHTEPSSPIRATSKT